MSLSLEELRSQTPAQLENQLRTLREEGFWLRMQRSVGQLTQWHLMGRTRRDIARVMTVLREKERERQERPPAQPASATPAEAPAAGAGEDGARRSDSA